MASTQTGSDSSSGKRVGKLVSSAELFCILALCCLSLILFYICIIYYGGAGGGVVLRDFEIYQLARNLSEGRGFTTSIVYPLCLKLYGGEPAHYPDMATAPLFPLFLSIFFLFFGVHDAAVLLCGFTLYAGGGVVVFLISRRFYDFKVAVVAMLFYVCNFTVLSIAVRHQSILLPMVLMTLFLFSLRRISSSRASLISSGILLGLVYLSNYELLPVIVPCAILLVFLFLDRKTAGLLAWFLFPFVIISFPFMVRNQILTGCPLYGLALYKYTEQLQTFIKPELFAFNWGRFFLAFRYFLPTVLSFPGSYVALFSIAPPLLSSFPREKKWFLGVFAMYFLYFCFRFALRGRMDLASSVFLPFFLIVGTRGFFILIEGLPRQPWIRRAFVAFFIALNLVPLMNLSILANPWYLEQDCFDQLLQPVEKEKVIVTDVPELASWFGRLNTVKLPKTPADFVALKEQHQDAGDIFLSIYNFAADWPPDIYPGDWRDFYASLSEGYLPREFLSAKVRYDPLGNVYVHDIRFSQLPGEVKSRADLK